MNPTEMPGRGGQFGNSSGEGGRGAGGEAALVASCLGAFCPQTQPGDCHPHHRSPTRILALPLRHGCVHGRHGHKSYGGPRAAAMPLAY